MTKAINVRPRARGRVGVVWSALWVIKRKQRELIALAANLILLIYAFNCALSNDDFRGFGALAADVEAGNEVVAVDAHAVEVVEFDGSVFVSNDDFGYARVVDGDVLFAVEADALVFEEVFGCCFVMGDDWKGKFDFLKPYCDVVYLPRTPGISTTKIKEDLK